MIHFQVLLVFVYPNTNPIPTPYHLYTNSMVTPVFLWCSSGVPLEFLRSTQGAGSLSPPQKKIHHCPVFCNICCVFSASRRSAHTFILPFQKDRLILRIEISVSKSLSPVTLFITLQGRIKQKRDPVGSLF